MHALSSQERAAVLKANYDALMAAEPKLRARERATRLQVSEAELVAAQCGVEAKALNGTPQDIFLELASLGEVMVLSRNDWCVHERHGRYEEIHAKGPVGMVLGKDIDLRMFFSHWKHAFAVTENSRLSVQFFDAEGTAIHKVYITEKSDSAAYDALVQKLAAEQTPAIQIEAYPADSTPTHCEDPAALRSHWLSLTDTHSFFPMLKQHKVTRLGALKAAGADLAQVVAIDAVETMLLGAAELQVPIMCFVSNRGMVQIHSGPIQKLLRTGPWFNILDPMFNLHLDTSAISECWVVRKLTSDGWVTSLEVYTATGELMVQFFGARRPGVPELPEWCKLLSNLCATSLAG